MTKSFFPHLGTIFVLHLLIILGSIELVQNHHQTLSVGTSFKVKLAGAEIIQKAYRPKSIERSQKSSLATQQVAPTASQEVVAVERPGISADLRASVADAFKSELRARIEQNKTYPPMSRRLGQTGTVIIAFTLLEDGHIINARVDAPSAFERLNTAALEAVQKVHVFRPIPKELGEDKMDFKVPLKFLTI